MPLFIIGIHMNIRNFTLAFFFLIMTSCATTSPTPTDYNPEIDGTDFDPVTGKAIPEQATPYLVVAYKDAGVIIEVLKVTSFYDDQNEVELQNWAVIATNNNRRDICLSIAWRLMDFQFISDYPTTLLMFQKSKLRIGTMVGKTMNIDGVIVALSPSGYVHQLEIRDPDWSTNPGFECFFLDDDIIEQ